MITTCSPMETLIDPENVDRTEEVELTGTVDAEGFDNGLRLDRVLQRRFPRLTRSHWQERIRSALVLVNGEVVRPSRRIQTGDRISFQYTKKAEPSIRRDFTILYDDEHFLAIDKPPNLPLHPSGNYFKNTLYFLMKEKMGVDFVVRFVHRIDRETSGVLLLARSSEAAHLMQRQFQSRSVVKEYFALVEGQFPEYLDARGYLTGCKKSRVRRKRCFHSDASEYENGDVPAGGESARTEFLRLRHRAGVEPVTLQHGEISASISLLKARLHTGRNHQIRATLCSLGYPMVGDRIYGYDETLYEKFLEDRESEEEKKMLRMNRTALHSSLLEFTHPFTQERIKIKSPMPEDMKELAETL